MGLYRLIPIGKTYYLLRKTYFLGEQKTSKGNIKGNTLDSIYSILMRGKTPLSYYFKTLPLRRKVSKILILPHLPFKLSVIFIYYLYKIIYLFLAPFLSLYPIYIYIF